MNITSCGFHQHFEEQFPSLMKMDEYWFKYLLENDLTAVTETNSLEKVSLVDIEGVMKHCLDKQRVMEARGVLYHKWLELQKYDNPSPQVMEDAFKEFDMEVGL